MDFYEYHIVQLAWHLDNVIIFNIPFEGKVLTLLLI